MLQYLTTSSFKYYKYNSTYRKFEFQANGILEQCWAKDRQYTSDLLVRESSNWGDCTVLSLAYRAKMKEFLAQPACYNKLSKIWRGDISLQTPAWRVSYKYCSDQCGGWVI